MHYIKLLPLLLIAFLIACSSASEETDKPVSIYGSVGNAIDDEWAVYVKNNPTLSEEEAKQRFDNIQKLSLKALETYDEALSHAAFIDRKQLANAWIRKEVEEVFTGDIVSEDMLRAAYDAYAFNTGNPTLQTVSHLLLRESASFDEEEAKAWMQSIYQALKDTPNLQDSHLFAYAIKLNQAGQRSEVNVNLKFPRRAMPTFLGMRLAYHHMVEPFAEAAFKLHAQNILSPPIRSEFGYHVILFKETHPSYRPPFNEHLKTYLHEKILDRGRTAALDQALETLQGKAHIQINEELLRSILQGE